MRKKYFLIAGIIWLVLVGFGLYYYNKPHTSAANMEIDASIAAVDLYNQYAENEISANKKFLDKIIEVKGKVVDMQQAGNSTNIQLDGGSPAGGVNCSIAENSSQIKLPGKGSMVTVKGRCSGFLMDVNLVDCVLEQ